ncbi:unnamed protein product [Periconia digitata]|uniref:Uncharacterized protein n=1 Tax=Periconia digitata TaxID=1303443 RepID=A0A9W4UQ63_9PLEO|nr:unnamed protein product [Periconia digitata]
MIGLPSSLFPLSRLSACIPPSFPRVASNKTNVRLHSRFLASISFSMSSTCRLIPRKACTMMSVVSIVSRCDLASFNASCRIESSFGFATSMLESVDDESLSS